MRQEGGAAELLDSSPAFIGGGDHYIVTGSLALSADRRTIYWEATDGTRTAPLR